MKVFMTACKRQANTTLPHDNAETQIRAAAVKSKVFFFHLGFTTHQDYFTHFEPSQSLGGAKMGDPREKLPDHPQAELGLSNMIVTRARLEPTAVR